MKSMFSKFVLAPAVLVAASLAADVASAEATVKVPFNFTASGKICPAGYYTIQREGTSNFVTLSHKGSSEILTYILGPGASDTKDSKIALTFDKVAGSLVLQSVQYGSLATSRLDKKSLRDMERESIRLTGGR